MQIREQDKKAGERGWDEREVWDWLAGFDTCTVVSFTSWFSWATMMLISRNIFQNVFYSRVFAAYIWTRGLTTTHHLVQIN